MPATTTNPQRERAERIRQLRSRINDAKSAEEARALRRELRDVREPRSSARTLTREECVRAELAQVITELELGAGAKGTSYDNRTPGKQPRHYDGSAPTCGDGRAGEPRDRADRRHPDEAVALAVWDGRYTAERLRKRVGPPIRRVRDQEDRVRRIYPNSGANSIRDAAKRLAALDAILADGLIALRFSQEGAERPREQKVEAGSLAWKIEIGNDRDDEGRRRRTRQVALDYKVMEARGCTLERAERFVEWCRERYANMDGKRKAGIRPAEDVYA